MEEIPWLDATEFRAWFGLAGVMMRVPALLDRQLQRDAGISHFEYGILSGLSEAPGRTLQMSFLARFANGSPSRLSHAVKRLEDRGWVRRNTSPADGRLTEATLTEAGWDKVREAAVGHVLKVRDVVIDRLTPLQIRQLGAISTAILEGSEELRCAVRDER